MALVASLLLLTFACQSYAELLSARPHINLRRPTTQELLKQETDKIQRHIDLVDEALSGVTGQGRRTGTSDTDLLGLGLSPMSPSPVVQGQVVLSQAKPADRQSMAGATGARTAAALVQQHRQLPDWYQKGNITYGNGTWYNPGYTESDKIEWSQNDIQTNENPDVTHELAEWSYDHGSYTFPHRNKIVLAVIELVPFLGVFGMDRLYLGQPVMAVLKAGSFVCTAGVVGGLWALIDAFLIAHNCLEERAHIDTFGMIARFDSNEYEMKMAAAIGGLIYLSWALHIIWFAYLLYKFITRRRVEYYDPEAPPGVMLRPRGDPFFTGVANFKNHAINLKKDPFLQQLPSYEQGQKLQHADTHGTLPPNLAGTHETMPLSAGALGDTLGSTWSNAGPLRQDEVADFH